MAFLFSLFSSLFKLCCPSSGPSDDKPQQQELQQTQWQQQPPPHAPVPAAPHHAPTPHKPQHKPPHTEPQHQQQQQQPYTPSHSPRPPKQHVDLNQVNQHDSHYMELRRRANEEGDQMASCFDRSHDAYQRGDGALAKELSNEGKEHKVNMEKLNKEASDWIFEKNNEDSQPGEVDLHGLYVKEAIVQTEAAIARARQRGDKEIRLIVGQGLHSAGGAAKIRPAIEELMQKESLAAELDHQNAGVLVVGIDAQNRGIGADEITRRLGKDDEGCVVM